MSIKLKERAGNKIMSPNILRAEMHGYLNDNTRKIQVLKMSKTTY